MRERPLLRDGHGGPHDPRNRSRSERGAASRDAAPAGEDPLKEEEDVVTVRAAERRAGNMLPVSGGERRPLPLQGVTVVFN